MSLDRLVGINGFVTHGHAQIPVTREISAMWGGRPLRMASVMKTLRKS